MSVTWIAELGINHHGDLDKAKRMIEMAHEAGATYIKGQFYNPYKVLGREHPDLQYALQCQFSRKEHENIFRYADSLGARYFVSVFDEGDIGWAASFSSVMKVASRMNKNQEFISRVEATKKPTFMSIQPSNQGLRIPERFKLMWCVRDYPTLKEDVLTYPYSKDFGLSSHCPDPSATLEAIKLGATVVENHLVESREEEGCDVSSSLTFNEYKTLIKEVSSMRDSNVSVSEVQTSPRTHKNR